MQASRAVRSLVAKSGEWHIWKRIFVVPNQICVVLVGRRSYHHHDGPITTINDLPSPQGNWKTHYDANQRKYNAQLAAGVGLLIGSLIFGKAAGFLELYNDIPARPADIPSYK